MNDRYLYLIRLGLFLGAAILSGCGGCFGKMTAGELACDALSLESTRVEPYTWATLHVDFAEELPEDTDKIEVLAELTMIDWEPRPLLLQSRRDDLIQFQVPSYIPDPMAGGAVTLQFQFDEQVCDPMALEIEALPPAPGATLELMERSTRLQEATIASLGLDVDTVAEAVSFENSTLDSALPLPAWPIALGMVATDHPALERSFYDALREEVDADERDEWLDLLDAQIGSIYDFDDFDIYIDWLQEHPVDSIGFAPYERDDASYILESSGIPFLLPEINGAQELSKAMTWSAAACASMESQLEQVVRSVISEIAQHSPLMELLVAANDEFELVQKLKDAIDRNPLTLDDLEHLTDLSSDSIKLAKRALLAVNAIIIIDKMIIEVLRVGCEAWPSEITSIEGQNTPWKMNEDTSKPLNLMPLIVEANSQHYQLPNFLELLGLEPSAYFLNFFHVEGLWDFGSSLSRQEEVYRESAKLVSDHWLPNLLNVDEKASTFFDDLADSTYDVRTLEPFHWSVEFAEVESDSTIWVEVELLLGIVVRHNCPNGSGFCVRPNQRVGTDWVTLSLDAGLFPEAANIIPEHLRMDHVGDMNFEDFSETLEFDRPSFISKTDSIDVLPITIELMPNRMIGVEPGDLVHLQFIVKNADYPEADWSLTEGAFSSENYFPHETRHLISGPSQDSAHVAGEPYEGDHHGELYIDVPSDAAFVFPLSIRGDSFWEPGPWMDPDRDRSVTGYIDGERAYIVPKAICLEEGQQISVQLFGRYQEDNQVSWSASAGSIEARDDDGSGVDRAIYTAPNSEEDEITISATISGRSITGESQQSRAEVTYAMDCKCWWTAEFEGGAAGTMGGYKATMGQGIFQQILGSHNVSLSDENSDDGLMIGFPGQDTLQGNSFDASLHIFAERDDLLGGSLVEADMGQAYGLSLPKQITFTNYTEPFYSGHFTGRTLTMMEVLLHPLLQREPIPTNISAEFFADSENDCKSRRWFN